MPCWDMTASDSLIQPSRLLAYVFAAVAAVFVVVDLVADRLAAAFSLARLAASAAADFFFAAASAAAAFFFAAASAAAFSVAFFFAVAAAAAAFCLAVASAAAFFWAAAWSEIAFCEAMPDSALRLFTWSPAE